MKKITINTPDGKKLTLNAPDGATPDQIKQAAMAAVTKYKSTMAPQQLKPQATPEAPKEKGLMGKAWDALAKPAQMSREGWDMIAKSDAVQPNLTGNMVTDVIRGTPKVLAETAAEVAPSFVDRTSIVMGGAGGLLKAGGAAAGKVIPKVAPMLEAGSGLQKGTLAAAFKDPKMIADFGARLKATELYNLTKQGASLPPKLRTNAKIVSHGFEEIAKGKLLDAQTAFKTRKAVRAMLKSKDTAGSFPKDDLIELEKRLDDMVFSSADKADEVYKRAIRGEQMRHFARLNKNGTTGPFSAAIMTKLPFLAPLMSPVIQGGAASAAGAASQLAPRAIVNTGSMVGAGLDRLSKRKEKGRGKR